MISRLVSRRSGVRERLALRLRGDELLALLPAFLDVDYIEEARAENASARFAMQICRIRDGYVSMGGTRGDDGRKRGTYRIKRKTKG